MRIIAKLVETLLRRWLFKNPVPQWTSYLLTNVSPNLRHLAGLSLTNDRRTRWKPICQVFLHSLVPPKKLSAATAENLINFLISKDTASKTKIHTPSCSRRACDCPKRLSAGTADSYIGKLRTIFNRLGRTGFCNPLTHPSKKDYLKLVREQAQQLSQPSQAVPLFNLVKWYLTKLTAMS